jgi:ryanodine receptor 2
LHAVSLFQFLFVFFFTNKPHHFPGFSLNGELLMDALGGETTFADVQGDNFVPAFTFSVGQKARLCFGQDVTQLKYFTTCGLQEGYEPFCV